MYNLFYMKHNN